MSRITAWYRREQPFPRLTAVLSVVVVMVAALLAVMVARGGDSLPVIFAFGFAAGFGVAVTWYLILVIRAWRERSRSRRTQ